MKSILWVYFIVSFYKFGYSQNSSNIDSIHPCFKPNEVLIYDSLNNRYEKIHYSKFGERVYIERLDTNGYVLKDTTFGFYQNGRIAYYRIFKNGALHGDFAIYDSLGNLRYTGAYYKRFRIGVWKAFNENHKLYKSVKYKYSLADSSLIDQLIDNKTKVDKISLSDEINLYYRRENDIYINSINMISYGEIVKIKCRNINTNYMKEVYSDGIVDC